MPGNGITIISGMLFVLGGKLCIDCPSGKKGGLSVFYSGFPVKDGMPGIFSGVPHNKYPSGAGAGWTVELLMGFVYSVDAADNLFPSIHCLVSWFCYIGIRGKKEIPAWYRGASCVMAVLVCISTLTTKQHVLVDVFGGVALAELCFVIGKREVVWRKYEKLLDKVNEKIFHKEE